MLYTIFIDGTEIKTKANSSLLWVALDNGFYIPNLCSIRDIERPAGSCRLCFVEIEGMEQPVTACTEGLRDGMKVRLNSPTISRIRKSAFDLLLSSHKVDCAHCVKNKKCELQNIAGRERWKLNDKRFKKIGGNLPIDSSHPAIVFDRNKCVLCGKCVWVCHEEGSGILDFAYRGIRTMVATFADMPLAEAGCNSCLACVAICPVGALYKKQISGLE